MSREAKHQMQSPSDDQLAPPVDKGKVRFARGSGRLSNAIETPPAAAAARPPPLRETLIADAQAAEMAGPYILGKTLGRGTSGKVKEGWHKDTGMEVAPPAGEQRGALARLNPASRPGRREDREEGLRQGAQAKDRARDCRHAPVGAVRSARAADVMQRLSLTRCSPAQSPHHEALRRLRNPPALLHGAGACQGAPLNASGLAFAVKRSACRTCV
jgi:hypothetical protein